MKVMILGNEYSTTDSLSMVTLMDRVSTMGAGDIKAALYSVVSTLANKYPYVYSALGSLPSIPSDLNPTVGGTLNLGSLTRIPGGFNPSKTRVGKKRIVKKSPKKATKARKVDKRTISKPNPHKGQTHRSKEESIRMHTMINKGEPFDVVGKEFGISKHTFTKYKYTAAIASKYPCFKA